MEGPQCKLRTGLSDGLSRNHAYHFSFFHHPSGRQIPSVTLGTNTLFGFTGQYASDLNLFYGERRYLLGNVFGDRISRFHKKIAGKGIEHVVNAGTSQNTVVERFHHLVLVLDGSSH